jgi:hypothetical protein
MAPDPDLPRLEADEADLLDQQRSVGPDDEPRVPDHLDTVDADPADVLEQRQDVPLDDDAWPS